MDLDIIKAMDVLEDLIQKTENGDRDGWGYDPYCFKVTLQCLYNEQKMKGAKNDTAGYTMGKEKG